MRRSPHGKAGPSGPRSKPRNMKMRTSRILGSKKERKRSYVNDHRDRVDSALCFGIDYEFHHGRIYSHPSRAGAYSRARPPDPRTPIDVESELNEILGGTGNDPTKPPRGLADDAAWR